MSAGRVRHAVRHEGGWSGSNPKDAEFFTAAKATELRTARLAALGVHASQGHNWPEADPNLQALVAAETPIVIVIFGKSWRLHGRGTCWARNLDEKLLAMVWDSLGPHLLLGRDARSSHDAEHYWDGFRDAARLCARNPPSGRPRRCADASCCATRMAACSSTISWEIISRPGGRGFAVRGSGGDWATGGIHTSNDAGLAVANSLAAVANGIRYRPGHDQRFGRMSWAGNADPVTILGNLQLLHLARG